MRARFDAAQKAKSSGRRQVAEAAYRLALIEYQKGVNKPGYYVDIAGDFLTAGNCLWQQGMRRAAIAAYEKGLQNDPHSISLLTSAGLCSQQLGEFVLAGSYLVHSQNIYPDDRRVNQALQKLNMKSSGKKRQ
jgi:tetratricopeptide (TPR) repeat protein